METCQAKIGMVHPGLEEKHAGPVDWFGEAQTPGSAAVAQTF
ncbi:hypothetical protein MY1884_000214 [Beauveria asiatica]